MKGVSGEVCEVVHLNVSYILCKCMMGGVMLIYIDVIGDFNMAKAVRTPIK